MITIQEKGTGAGPVATTVAHAKRQEVSEIHCLFYSALNPLYILNIR